MIETSATVAQFLDEAAARKPTPGGGAVAALAGALAASMGEMVLNYSVGRKGAEQHQQILTDSLTKMNRARQMLVELMVEDQTAFESLSKARKAGGAAFGTALLACITVPETIAATGVSILQLCDAVMDAANVMLLSDLAVAADLAMTTVRCAFHNVRVNLKEVAPDHRRRIEASSADIFQHALDLIQRITPRLNRRMQP